MKIILYIHKIDPTQTLYICINILSTLYFRFCSLLFLFLPYFFPFTSSSSSFFSFIIFHSVLLHPSNCAAGLAGGWQAHSV